MLRIAALSALACLLAGSSIVIAQEELPEAPAPLDTPADIIPLEEETTPDISAENVIEFLPEDGGSAQKHGSKKVRRMKRHAVCGKDDCCGGGCDECCGCNDCSGSCGHRGRYRHDLCGGLLGLCARHKRARCGGHYDTCVDRDYRDQNLSYEEAQSYDPNCTVAASGQLFQQYYAPANAGGVPAQMYIAPYPVPPAVGHTYITYQAFEPHQFMYRHKRHYVRRHGPGGGETSTRIYWW